MLCSEVSSPGRPLKDLGEGPGTQLILSPTLERIPKKAHVRRNGSVLQGTSQLLLSLCLEPSLGLSATDSREDQPRARRASLAAMTDLLNYHAPIQAHGGGKPWRYRRVRGREREGNGISGRGLEGGGQCAQWGCDESLFHAIHTVSLMVHILQMRKQAQGGDLPSHTAEKGQTKPG